ncbi:hypothetical protein LOK49_LG05G00661 [Camellia lanceoleosa]|uniref:Uncharacterized protein n=1 Tax=Camellia lanceoleosa TaxID=1840588 RepID=A0ACC0HSJ8_9ERIC|nr:hypothetical protein LOK49_LG05G00661 [Camellia lanceoleosa]
MATRVARVADLASSLIGIVGRGCVSKIRWVSSLSEASLKPNKKITDRLFGVVDAVNDRKLPSELRGQRNTVSPSQEVVGGEDSKMASFKDEETEVVESKREEFVASLILIAAGNGNPATPCFLSNPSIFHNASQQVNRIPPSNGRIEIRQHSQA